MASVEFENVSRRVGQHLRACPPLGAVSFDDLGANQFVEPQRVDVIDRCGVQRNVGPRLGSRAICDLIELDDPTTVRQQLDSTPP